MPAATTWVPLSRASQSGLYTGFSTMKETGSHVLYAGWWTIKQTGLHLLCKGCWKRLVLNVLDNVRYTECWTKYKTGHHLLFTGCWIIYVLYKGCIVNKTHHHAVDTVCWIKKRTPPNVLESAPCPLTGLTYAMYLSCCKYPSVRHWLPSRVVIRCLVCLVCFMRLIKSQALLNYQY